METISREVTIIAEDGYPLGATVFEAPPSTRNGHVVIICSGTAIKQQFYGAYARFLSQRGYNVITFDYRGIRRARHGNLAGFQGNMHDWGKKDVSAVIAWACTEFQQPKIHVVGHSAGGWLTALATNNHQVQSMVTVASLHGY